MLIGVPKESFPGEQRVALIPASIALLAKVKAEVVVESGAGHAAGFPDAAYQEKGARIVPQRADLFDSSDLIVQVRGLGANPEAGRADLPLLRPGQLLIAFFDPLGAPLTVQPLAQRGVTALSMEMMPRITRAQSMDALSSMATVAGYKAVLLAAQASSHMFPMLMTAAGTVAPARVLVIGAGVSGLQAIATAHRLGAVVTAYDVRPAVKEQVQSLGAKFLELPLETAGAEDQGGYAKAMGEAFYARQREMMAKAVAEQDVVICTATVPGKRAPLLVTEEMVKRMAPGSIIVDLAAEGGGNCALTQPNRTINASGVTIMGPVNLAATIPYHASQMYAKNITAFILHLINKEGALQLKPDDEIVAGTLLTRNGEIVHPRVRELLGLPALTASST
ncbi:MAG TPA: Re/Si-specific NAD(P)(+) transhydrogenase subunit alpha [Nitrospiria bacterium]|nr:Re/Si-specific NAD(P)(+) transhydrogenase subunit alpha [Nitrospiria bacterium]